jgi:hypothetical protein
MSKTVRNIEGCHRNPARTTAQRQVSMIQPGIRLG